MTLFYYDTATTDKSRKSHMLSPRLQCYPLLGLPCERHTWQECPRDNNVISAMFQNNVLSSSQRRAATFSTSTGRSSFSNRAQLRAAFGRRSEERLRKGYQGQWRRGPAQRAWQRKQDVCAHNQMTGAKHACSGPQATTARAPSGRQGRPSPQNPARS